MVMELIRDLPFLSDLQRASASGPPVQHRQCSSPAPLSSYAPYCLMGNLNCCGSPDTVPSEPAPPPKVTQRTVPGLVQSRHSMERLPVFSPQLPRTRSRTTSAPQRPQSTRPPSPQNPRIRAETLSAPKRSSPPPTRGYPKGELLRSTVMQVSTDYLEYVT